MVSDSCVVQRLVAHDLTIIFPQKDEIERLHDIILRELSNNIFTKESKEYFIKVIQRLHDEDQVEGIVLGCTGKIIIFFILFIFLYIYIYLEIPILVKQTDIPHITLFDSTRLHVNNKKNILVLL